MLSEKNINDLKILQQEYYDQFELIIKTRHSDLFPVFKSDSIYALPLRNNNKKSSSYDDFMSIMNHILNNATDKNFFATLSDAEYTKNMEHILNTNNFSTIDLKTSFQKIKQFNTILHASDLDIKFADHYIAQIQNIATLWNNVNLSFNDYFNVDRSKMIDISKNIETFDILIADMIAIPSLNRLKEELLLLHKELFAITKVEVIHGIESEEFKKAHNDFIRDIEKNYTFFKNPQTATYNEYKKLLKIEEKQKIIEEVKNNIINQIIESGVEYISDGIDFLQNVTSNSISSFMKKRDITDEKVIRHITFPEDMSISEFILFDDESMVCKKNNNYYLLKDDRDKRSLINSCFDEDLKLRLKNNPYIYKALSTLLKNCNYEQYNNCVLVVDNFLENKDILKAANFNMVDFIKQNIKDIDFEILDDEMNRLIKEQKVQQYSHSILSNKYRHLYDEASYTIFFELYDAGVSSHMLQDLIGKKLASFKTSDDFNTALAKTLETYNSFDFDIVMRKAKEKETPIVLNEDNKVVLRIDTYEQSKAFGSSSWCIVRDEYYFNSYTENDNKQYFIFDFNKNSSDNLSLSGVTLTSKGKIDAAHKKNDDAFTAKEQTEHLKELVKKIVEVQPELYPVKAKSKAKLKVD